MRVVAYRLRTTLGRRVGGLLAIVVLVGLTGGIALGSIAGARRTQSSYPTFLASTHPSTMTVSAFSGTGGGSVSLTSRIAKLPRVRHVDQLDVVLGIAPLTRHGAPNPGEIANVFFLGSTDGELTAQDGITATQGRLADPARADEVVVTASGARQLRVHVGSVIRLGLFPDHSESNPVDVLRKDVKVVGVVDLDNQIVQDDIDAAFGFVMLTPALEREVASIAPSTVSPTTYALQLDHGVGDVSAVERELVRVIPPGQQYEFHALAPIVTQTEDSIKPESIALGAFGALAALVALVIAAQAISRQLRSGDHEREVLRALGAGPKVAVADGLVGVLAAVVVGALLAVVVAVALSPLTPLGPVRPVYPTPGLAFDWTVLGFGLALFIVALGGIAAVIAFRRAPHRLAGRRALQSGRRSRVRGGGRQLRPARAGCRRHRVRARSRRRPHRGADAFHAARDGGRGRACRRDHHVRERAADTRLAPRALRLELDLPDRPQRGGATRHPHPVGTRSRRGAVDTHALLGRGARRPERAAPARHGQGEDRAARALGPRRRVDARHRDRRDDTGTLAQACGRHRRAHLRCARSGSRLHPTDAAAHRRHRDLPGDRLHQLRRRPHVDGHRRPRVVRRRTSRLSPVTDPARPEPQRARPRVPTNPFRREHGGQRGPIWPASPAPPTRC